MSAVIVRLAWSCYLAGWQARQGEVDFLNAIVRTQLAMIRMPYEREFGPMLQAYCARLKKSHLHSLRSPAGAV